VRKGSICNLYLNKGTMFRIRMGACFFFTEYVQKKDFAGWNMTKKNSKINISTVYDNKLSKNSK
jgi:hypothetical protein